MDTGAGFLRVDLTEGRIRTEEKDDKFYRTYMGGRGFIAHYLLTETPKGCDPLGPENVLVFAPSVLTGTPIPGTARCSAGAKSPLTGAYGEGEGGGDWGVRFRWTGYDALVVRGRSEKPVYLWITEDTVELRDADALWGLEPLETLAAIRTDVGQKKAMAAMIGPGGEKTCSVRLYCPWPAQLHRPRRSGRGHGSKEPEGRGRVRQKNARNG